MTSRATFTSLLVLFAASTITSASCGGSDTKVPPPPSVATSTGVTSGDVVTAATGAGGSGGAGGMGSTGGAGGAGGTGGTTACVESSECPGMTTDCQTPICLAGVCDFYYVMDGAQLPMQSAGDCKAVVCAGAGATKILEDEQDPFDDKNPCTDDVCVAGATTHAAFPPGTLCGSPGSGKVCDGNGACI
ncbi:MAG: hypothetical protein ABI134_33190 [Byssovorax sp.]